MAETQNFTPVEVLADPSDQDLADMHRLATQLSETKRTLEEVTVNVERAVESAATSVFVIHPPQQDRIQATATLNLMRTHQGADAWIDDVVTEKEGFRNQGLSGILMDEAEGVASQVTDRVSLTSSATREDARRGYAKRGYELITESLFRKNKDLGQAEVPSNIEPLDDIAARDIESIATLLRQDPDATEFNLAQARKANTSRLLIARDARDAIGGIATFYACPIPVGYKSWVSINARTESDTAGLIAAAERELPQGATALNTTFAPPGGIEGYDLRPSGLYVLQLGGTALNSSVEK